MTWAAGGVLLSVAGAPVVVVVTVVAVVMSKSGISKHISKLVVTVGRAVAMRARRDGTVIVRELLLVIMGGVDKSLTGPQ